MSPHVFTILIIFQILVDYFPTTQHVFFCGLFFNPPNTPDTHTFIPLLNLKLVNRVTNTQHFLQPVQNLLAELLLFLTITAQHSLDSLHEGAQLGNILQEKVLEIAQLEVIQQVVQAKHADVDITVPRPVNDESQVVQRIGVDQSFVSFKSDQRVPIFSGTLNIEQIALVFIGDY